MLYQMLTAEPEPLAAVLSCAPESAFVSHGCNCSSPFSLCPRHMSGSAHSCNNASGMTESDQCNQRQSIIDTGVLSNSLALMEKSIVFCDCRTKLGDVTL